MTEASNGMVYDPDTNPVNASIGPVGRRWLFLCRQRTGGEQRRQPVFSIVFQASMALCRSIRRRDWGTGGLGGIQL